MTTPDLKEIHDFLVSLAFKAGDIITNAILDNNNSETGSKKNSTLEPDERTS
jgi:myo-inositol-1(or 4)-monophosphatase